MRGSWPELPYSAWRDTCSALHLCTQVVGKVRLAQTPWRNHGWHVALYVTARGLCTSSIPHGDRSFEMELDFVEHVLEIRVSDGRRERIPLEPQTVADFYAKVMRTLAALGLPVSINDYPCEIPGAIRFSNDVTHRPYDKEYAHRFWQVLLRADHVMKRFLTGFLGKSSPVHFFWGSFDLAVTRFSGRRAPDFTAKVPGLATSVMREAYSHEVSSAGFWPGGNGIDYAAFYSYAYPAPAAFNTQPVQPAAAAFNESLGEFLLPYDAVRTAADPERTLLSFLQSTYEAAAITGQWDRSALECPLGRPGSPRAV